MSKLQSVTVLMIILTGAVMAISLVNDLVLEKKGVSLGSVTMILVFISSTLNFIAVKKADDVD